mgnify:CR=1 FL=1
MIFGEKLQQLRKEKGWRLQDLSNESGVSLATLTLLENNRNTNVTVDTLGKIAVAFGLSFEELIKS